MLLANQIEVDDASSDEEEMDVSTSKEVRYYLPEPEECVGWEVVLSEKKSKFSGDVTRLPLR